VYSRSHGIYPFNRTLSAMPVRPQLTGLHHSSLYYGLCVWPAPLTEFAVPCRGKFRPGVTTRTRPQPAHPLWASDVAASFHAASEQLRFLIHGRPHVAETRRGSRLSWTAVVRSLDSPPVVCHIRAMKTSAIVSDPEIMGGAPVFRGTRVPVQTLLDYLEADDSIAEFLKGFPTVNRKQVVAALEQMKEQLLVPADA